MLEPDIERALRSEGFRLIYDWRDEPHTEYPDHAHLCLTAHIILEGERSVTMEGRTRIYRAGERFDVPAGTVHSAKMGPAGCRYMVGRNRQRFAHRNRNSVVILPDDPS